MQTISIPSWLPWALLVITLSAVALYFATRRGNGAHQNFNGFAGGGQPRQPLMDPEGPEFTGQIDQAGEAVQASRSYRAMRFTPDGGFEKVSTHMKKHTGRQ